MRRFRQGDAPVILYSPSGVKLFDFGMNRIIETDDDDLINLLLAMGAIEIPAAVSPVPQDLTEVAARLNALDGRVTTVETRVTRLEGASPGSGGTGAGDANLSADMDVTKAVGGVNPGASYAAGTPIETVMRDMLCPALAPTLTPPTVGVGGNYPAMAVVGQEIAAANVTVTLHRGSISPQYGAESPYRAGAASGYSLKLEGASVAFEESNTTGAFSLPAFTRNSKGDVSLTGTANHGQGPQPKNSAGADYDAPLPAGSKTGAKTIRFVIPFKYGVAADISNIDLSALTNDVTAKANKTYTFATTRNHMVFAYDADYGALSSIKDANNFETLNGWTKTVQDGMNVYAFNNATTDPSARYTFTF